MQTKLCPEFPEIRTLLYALFSGILVYFDFVGIGMALWLATLLFIVDQIKDNFDLITKKGKSLTTILEKKFNRIVDKTAKKGLDSVKQMQKVVLETGDSMVNPISIASLGKNINNHTTGLSLCVGSVVKAQTMNEVICEIFKICSLLGLEEGIINGAMGKVLQKAGKVKLEDRFIDKHDIEDYIPLIGSLVSSVDFNFDIKMSNYLDRRSKNIKNIKTIAEELSDVLIGLGLKTDGDSELILGLTDRLLQLREDHEWMSQLIMVNMNELMKISNQKRIQEFKQKLKTLESEIRKVPSKVSKNNKIFSDINTLVMAANKSLIQIETARQSYGFRPMPVGVCLVGVSHIGKTELARVLFQRIFKYIGNKYGHLFGNAHDFKVWDIQFRDEFDTGYFGQEGIYADDAWQLKDNSDHPLWYTFLSSSSVGTNQAVAELKGLLMRALLALLTCNGLPTNSITVSDLPALWNRFPYTIRCEQIKNKTKDFDPNFEHLAFNMGPMSAFTKNIPEDVKEVDLDTIVETIGDAMAANMTMYNQKLSLVKACTEQIEQHNKPIEESEDFIDVSDIDDDLIFKPDIDLIDLIIPEEDEEEEEDQSEIEIEEIIRLEDIGPEDRENNINNILHDEILLPKIEKNIRRIAQPFDKVSDKASKLLKAEFKNAINGPITRNIKQLGGWIYHIQHKFSTTPDQKGKKGTPLTILQWLELNPDAEVSDFIYNLNSNWEITNKKLFDMLWLKQIIIKINIEDDKKILIPVFWGPMLLQGQVFLRDTYHIRNECVKSENFIKGLFYKVGWMSKDVLTYHRMISKYVIVGISTFKFPDYLFVVAPLILLGEIVPMKQAEWWVGYETCNNVGKAQYWLNYTSNLYWWAPYKIYEKLETVSLQLHNYIVKGLLWVLELFGMDTSGIWKDMANIVTSVALQTAIVAALIGIMYGIYKCIYFLWGPKEKKSILKKTEKVEKHNSNSDKRRGKAKKVTPKQIKRFQQHEGDESDDEEGDFPSVQLNKAMARNILNSQIIDIVIDKMEEYEVIDLDCTIIHVDKSNELSGKISFFKNEREVIYTGENKFHHLESQSLYDNDIKGISLSFDIFGSRKELKKAYDYYVSCLHQFKLVDYMVAFNVTSYDEGNKFAMEVFIYVQRTSKNGYITELVKADYAKLRPYREQFNSNKEISNVKVKDIIQCGSNNNHVEVVKSLIKSNQVLLLKPSTYDDFDSSLVGKSVYGLGHKNSIHSIGHTFEVDDLVKFWRNKVDKRYNLAKVVYVDRLRDRSVLTIMESKDYPRFRRILPATPFFSNIEKYLIEDFTDNILDTEVTVQLPKTNFLEIGKLVSYEESNFTSNSGKEHLKYLEINSFKVLNRLSEPGDCGGLIVSYNQGEPKLLGFHAGVGRNFSYGAFIIKSDLSENLNQHAGDFIDPWKKIILKGDPVDLPKGEDVEYIGRYAEATVPVIKQNINHWHKSPWFEQFEEQLQPACLSPYDERIGVDIPVNMKGEKSLLLIPNSEMCKKLPELDQKIVDKCTIYLIKYFSGIMGKFNRVPDDFDEMMRIVLNGRPDNKFCTGMELNKAVGLPWNSMPGVGQKKDLIDHNLDTNYKDFNDEHGLKLRSRIYDKVQLGNQGKRIISFSNSKLKDETTKLSNVKNGKTRVYHSIPVDKIMTDSAVFGDFKERFQQLNIKLHHGVGIDVHTRDWAEMYNYMNRYDKCFDLDYKFFDKYLHKQIMEAAYEIVIQVIKRNAPDNHENLRRVLAFESIHTYIVDYDTVYKTNRSMKSGEYMTTIINCISNLIYSMYAWNILVDDNFSSFFENVCTIVYGDDKIVSVSDEFIERYNYFTNKKVLEDIGHIITPGNKDGLEVDYVKIDQLQFLKRSFKVSDEMILAPLLTRSIEGPFTWTTINDNELGVWGNLIQEQLIEASLHGEEYYEIFQNKLRNCNSRFLESLIVTILRSYDYCRKIHRKRYYE